MSTPDTPFDVLTRCFLAGVVAAQPERALSAHLPVTGPSGDPVFVVAVGKASIGMSRALVEWLAAHRRIPADGVIVAPDIEPSPHHALQVFAGDHPIPGERSYRAAEAIDTLVRSIPDHAEIHVAISGGTSSLLAGPLPPLTMHDVTSTFVALLSSGLDIREMNAVRKRVSRWSAGRLAQALSPRQVFTWIISDVVGDDSATIGSGPCAGDPSTSREVRALVAKAGIARQLTPAVSTALLRETPKPTDPAFQNARTTIVASNRSALLGAKAEADRLGIPVRLIREPLEGEASAIGSRFAEDLRMWRGGRSLIMRGGETTVTIRGTAGRGGRSQELALAAAKGLRGAPSGTALLAAGTDGRDGPTDAAGAIVDGSTWDRIIAAGIDPDAALNAHDAYTALDAAGALLKTGSTGTNVADLVMGMAG